jgi:hypothetical protein
MPLLPMLKPGAAMATIENGVLDARWGLRDGRRLRLVANLKEQSAARHHIEGDMLWDDAAAAQLPPWSVFAVLEP